MRSFSASTSVVICTRDRPEKLKICLDSLLKLERPVLEIILIDNCPTTSSTRELASGYPVRYFLESRPGLSVARNRAIREARGDFLAFTDDDCQVDINWLENLTAHFPNKSVMGCTGQVLPASLDSEAERIFEQMRYLRGGPVMATYHGLDPLPEVSLLGAGANMAFRRIVFDRVGWFDEALGQGTLCQGGEDLDMFYRVLKAGYGLIHDPEAVVRHSHREKYEELPGELFRYSAGHFSYLFKCFRYYGDRSSMKYAWRVFWKANLRKWLLAFFKPQDLSFQLLTYKMLGCLAGPLYYLVERRRRKSCDSDSRP